MKEKLTVLIGEKEIQSRVEKLAAEISESYKGESLLVVGILRGAIMFMVDLLKKLEIDDVQIDFMAVSSYGSEGIAVGMTTSTPSHNLVKVLKAEMCLLLKILLILVIHCIT